MYPCSQRAKFLAFTILFSCGLATAVRAEPIRVTGGYIQVGATGTDFLIETTSGPIGGEQEGVNFPPIISGFSGEVVSLSRTYVGDLGHFTIGGVDLPGTRQLRVRRGRRDTAVPLTTCWRSRTSSACSRRSPSPGTSIRSRRSRTGTRARARSPATICSDAARQKRRFTCRRRRPARRCRNCRSWRLRPSIGSRMFPRRPSRRRCCWWVRAS